MANDGTFILDSCVISGRGAHYGGRLCTPSGRKGFPPHSRPAYLPQPGIAKTAIAERLFERAIDEIDAEPLAVHELRRGSVLRDLGAKRANPAALSITSRRHNMVLPWANPDPMAS